MIKEALKTRTSSLPTSRAIDVLVHEWISRTPPIGIRKEVLTSQVLVKSAQFILPTYFIAVIPTEEAKQKILSYIPQDDLHLTLAYLGNKREDEIEQIKLRLQMMMLNQKALDIRSDGYGTFTRSNITHMRIKPTNRLVDLSLLLRKEFGASGVAPAFVPHITTAKSLKTITGPDLQFKAKSIVLIKSSKGVGYEIIAEYQLQDLTILDKIKDFFNVLL